MKKLLFLWAVLGISLQWTTAQVPHRCGSFEYNMIRKAVVPGYAEAVEKTFQKAKAYSQSAPFKAQDEILRVPIVVHVIYNTPEENLSDAVIQRQIEILNRDYRRQNSDAADTRAVFQPVAADAGIEFFLATADPDGNPTTGITRTPTDVENFSGIDIQALMQALQECGVTDPNDMNQLLQALPCLMQSGFDFASLLNMQSGLDQMKDDATGGKDPWPTDRYLNIWVCDLGGAILGFAYPPAEAPNWPAGSAGTAQTDGVVIHYQVLSDNNPTTPPQFNGVVDRGRTCVHEVGHYLGLRHIWGDADCSEDDGLADTPDADAASQQTCDYNKNTCNESPEVPDMIENYMDYSDEDCMNMFTADQVAIMRAMLLGPRSTLLAPIDIEVPNAAFSANTTTAVVGQEVVFTDQSTGGTEWFWDFGDGTTSFDPNPTHTYSEPGTYTVVLSVSNSAGADYETITIVVTQSTATESNPLSDKVSISPNPSTNGWLTFNSSIQSHITVNNIAGQQVLTMQAGTGKTLINLSEQPNGIYFVTVKTSDASGVFKISLQR